MNGDRHQQFQFSLVYIALALVVLYGSQRLAGDHVQNLPYSDFKQQLYAGRIREVVISPTEVRGQYVDEQAKGGAHSFVASRVEDPELLKTLEGRAVRFTGRSGGGLESMLFWVFPILVMTFIWKLMARRMSTGGHGILAVGQSKARVVADDEAKRTTFADVAGIDEARDELEEVVDFLGQPGKYESLGGRIPKGILLIGPPGTGKTLLARAVAGEARVPFFSISGSEFVEMFVGVGAARVRDLFGQAVAKAPCIIFIDELDALGKVRGGSVLGGNDEREQTLNQLLVEMDGFDTRKGVIIMAATNRPETLDPALLRPGRFDRQIVVDRPDMKGREAILRLHSKGVKLAADVDLATLAARTPGFAGADLANLINEAALLAGRRLKAEVGVEDLEEAIDRLIAGLGKKQRLISPQERRVVAYHEAGHAVVASRVQHADPVHKVSIVPRGTAGLGYTVQLPSRDRYLMSKRQLEDRLAVLLGGRVAEEIFMGEVTTGSHGDLATATEIARAMVRDYGMSDAVGLATYDNLPFGARTVLPWQYEQSRSCSEQTAAAIDAEIRRILDETCARVRGIVRKNSAGVEAVARRLLEKEVIAAEELRSVLVASAAQPADLQATTGGTS